MLTTVDFSRYFNFTLADFGVAGKSTLWPIAERGKHLARLIIIGIDRLLTENNEVYTLFLYNRFQEFGNGEGFKRFIVLNKNAPVGAERERSAYLLLTLCRTNRYRDNLIRSSGFLHADSLFNGNFTERIDCHLGIGEVDTCPV